MSSKFTKRVIAELMSSSGYRVSECSAYSSHSSESTIGWSVDWYKEPEGWVFELNVWLADAYAQSTPGLLNISPVQWILGKEGIAVKPDFASQWEPEHFWIDEGELLTSAISTSVLDWARSWVLVPHLVECYKFLQDKRSVQEPYFRSIDLQPLPSPINAYILSRLHAELGNLNDSISWLSQYGGEPGLLEGSKARLFEELTAGDYEAKYFSDVEFTESS